MTAWGIRRKTGIRTKALTWNLRWQLADLVPVVAQVLGHPGVERPPHQNFGKLLEQAVLADQAFWFLLVCKQAVRRLDQLKIGLYPLVALQYSYHDSLMLIVSRQIAVYAKRFTPSSTSTIIRLRPDQFAANRNAKEKLNPSGTVGW